MKIIPALPAAPLTQTVIDMIRARAPMHPTRDAVICGTTRRSWRDFSTCTNQAAQALMALGVKKGSRVAMLSPNSVAMAELFIATLKAGAIAVPLSSMASPEALAGMLTDCEAEVFFLASSYAELGAQAVARAPRVFDPEGQEWQSLCEKQPDLDPNVAVEMEDGFNIIYSSGTTGVPKGILHSHAMRAAQMDRITPNGYDAEARTLLSTPLCSNTTLVSFLPTLAGGSTAILMAKFDAKTWLELAEREAVTHTMLVPVLFRRLLDHPAFTRDLTKGVRLFVSGSAPLLAETHGRFEERTGHRILERYGMTETNMNTSNPYDGDRRAGTVGLPLPGVELKITDPATGATLPQGEVGVIEVRGANVFQGYWQMPEKTREELREDGFFITGDLARMDADGYVTIIGRGKDLIISGGFNVYPKEVETLLDEQPGVLESAVIGVPHPDLGEVAVGILVRQKGQEPDLDQIAAAMGQALARFKQPRTLIVVDELPRNTMGKVQKNILRQSYGGLFS